MEDRRWYFPVESQGIILKCVFFKIPPNNTHSLSTPSNFFAPTTSQQFNKSLLNPHRWPKSGWLSALGGVTHQQSWEWGVHIWGTHTQLLQSKQFLQRSFCTQLPYDNKQLQILLCTVQCSSFDLWLVKSVDVTPADNAGWLYTDLLHPFKLSNNRRHTPPGPWEVSAAPFSVVNPEAREVHGKLVAVTTGLIHNPLWETGEKVWLPIIHLKVVLPWNLLLTKGLTKREQSTNARVQIHTEYVSFGKAPKTADHEGLFTNGWRWRNG